MDLFQWITVTLDPETCTSGELIYEDMESQSGRSLPIIYQPFDPTDPAHWRDRGALFDYLYATRGEGCRLDDQRLLDFGPGDGWPSLIVAPYVAEVIGVDGARKRVEVCCENAARLGLENTRFVYVPPGDWLPFDDASFDGVTAASSVEQTPDPRATLAELFRVLRPGGRLRISCEALGRYRDGQERELWPLRLNGGRSRLMLFDRDLEAERVHQYGLTYDLTPEELVSRLADEDGEMSFATVTPSALEALAPHLLDARTYTTRHPSGSTLARWLREAGFREVTATHNGIAAAHHLFARLPASQRPHTLAAIDALVRPVAELATQLRAPLDTDPMLTAVKCHSAL